jgi:ATPase, YjeE family
MATIISHSPAETEALGEAWGRAAASGLVIALCGDLGAGKTQLVKGLARGLDIAERVHSPTFSLLNVYSNGRLPLYHIDLYRLDTREQIIAAGLEEYLAPQGVTIVEWADRWFDEPNRMSAKEMAAYPKKFTWTLIQSTSETDRRITYERFGH